MSISATYAHTNLIAEDWRALARFYQDVFGCFPVREVDFQGGGLGAGVRIARAHLRGVHLRLPGHGEAARPSRFSPTIDCSAAATRRRTGRGMDTSRSGLRMWSRRGAWCSRRAAVNTARLPRCPARRPRGVTSRIQKAI